MSRLDMIDPAAATGKTKELLEGVAKKLGFLPTLMRVLANSPSALRGYLGFSGALAGGALPVQLRERIAISVAEVNGCRCCLAAHTEYGRRAGLTARDLEDARAGASSDPAAAEALRFARVVMDTCGNVADQDLAAVRAAGFDDGEIVEIAAIVAMNVFSNSVNNLAQSSPDFPDVAAARS